MYGCLYAKLLLVYYTRCYVFGCAFRAERLAQLKHNGYMYLFLIFA